MLITQKRPRVLSWFHAGPLLFGDWGTSRLYVLGLAFYYTAHASVIYLALMGALMAAVAWAYTVVCRLFPEGGGVYTAARHVSPLLSVVGATLLLCGYVITVSLSTLEAYHYFGCPEGPGGMLILTVTVLTIAGIGGVNWLGAKSAGRLAIVIAVISVAASIAVAIACAPLVGTGLARISFGAAQPTWDRWQSFVHIVLALSGVEAVANMTGLMKAPVGLTAKKTIWPVLIEVAILNMIFGAALNGLPQLAHTVMPDALNAATMNSPGVAAYRDTAMKVLAEHSVGPLFGKAAAIVFGLLLLSASNTAIMASVSVLYAMAQDAELPRPLTRLNYPGVPWISLILACLVPAVVLVIERDVERLADLYAVGVCGAITVNMLSCAVNRELAMKAWERRAMLGVGLVVLGIELTILFTKPHATLFAGAIVASVLSARWAVHVRRARMIEEPMPEPDTGWLAEVERAQINFDASKPRIMLAARGRNHAEFAVELAKKRGATLFTMYVRTLRVLDVVPGQTPRIQDDAEALQAIGTAAVLARQAGVPFVPIYVCSSDIADEILDYTVTFGCDTLIMGKSVRWRFSRALEGDVIAKVAQHLPEGVSLITRAVERPAAAEKV